MIKSGIDEVLKIFSSLKSVLLFLTFSVLFWIVMVVAPNFRVVRASVAGESPFISSVGRSIYQLFSGFLISSQISTVLISILFGINLVLFIKLRSKNKKLTGKTATATTGGLFFSLLGAGCGACGILAVSFLSFFGMGTLVAALPLGGLEFDIAGLVLLTVSSIFILNALIENNCKINHGK